MKRIEVKKDNRRAQIWVETVLYTLIAFVMIGLVLAFAKPKIEELQDKAIIDQSIAMMKDIDTTILTIGAPGNQRLIELGIKKGELTIDGENDLIVFEMKSKAIYSEPGEDVSDGNLIIRTEQTGDSSQISLTRDYSEEYNITYEDKDEPRTISKTPTSYEVLISNNGGDNNIINFEIN